MELQGRKLSLRIKNYLHNLLSDLSRLIDIQSVFSVSDN